MATTVRLKRSTTASAVPTSLLTGELAINHADRKIYAVGSNGTSVEEIIATWIKAPLVAAANTFGDTQTISASASVVSGGKTYLWLKPTDYGAGKGALFVNKDATSNSYSVGIYDSASGATTLNLNATTIALVTGSTLTTAPGGGDSIVVQAGTAAATGGKLHFKDGNAFRWSLVGASSTDGSGFSLQRRDTNGNLVDAPFSVSSAGVIAFQTRPTLAGNTALDTANGVQKSGDTMTGALTATGLATSTVGGTIGSISVQPGNSTSTGYIEFKTSNGTRQAYLGYGTASTGPACSSDNGYPWQFTVRPLFNGYTALDTQGNQDVSGYITLGGLLQAHGLTGIQVVNGQPAVRVVANANNDPALIQFTNNAQSAQWATISGSSGAITIGASYLFPAADTATSLGGPSNRWNTIYASTGTINTSDENEKNIRGGFTDAELDAWGEVHGYVFQFKDAVVEKGEDHARYHFGYIAQRVKTAFESHGVDVTQLAIWCSDELEDGSIREGLRYDLCSVIEAAYHRRRADRLEARIEALEKA